MADTSDKEHLDKSTNIQSGITSDDIIQHKRHRDY